MPNFRSLAVIGLFLIAVAIASFLGFKLYLDYQVKTKVDAVIQSLWSFAKVEYADLNVGVDGQVELAGVVIRPFEIEDEVNIAKVSLHIPDLEFLLDAEEALASGKIPESMLFAIEGMEISAKGEIFQGLRREVIKLHGQDSLCLHESAKYALLSDLGYEHYRVSANLHYEYRVGEGKLVLSSKQQDENIGEYDFEVELQLPSSHEMASGNFERVRFIKAKLNIKDTGYNERLVAYCSTKLRISKARYLDRLVQRGGIFGIEDLRLGRGLQTGYRNYLQSEGEMFISATPGQPVNPMNLIFYAPQDLMKELGIAVNVNGEPVHDLRIDFSSTEQAPLFKEFAEKVLGDSTLEEESVSQMNKGEEILTLRYVPIEVSQLSDYKGHQVKVLTRSGFERTGVLSNIEKGEIIVSWGVGRGEMAANIPVNSIKHVELLVYE